MHDINSVVSNERLESLQRQFMEEGFNDIRDSEVMQLVEENLALRKERGRSETVGVPDLDKVVYHFRDLNEGFPVERFKADYVIAWMLANYPPTPPAPVVPVETFEEWSRRCEIQLTLCRPEFREVAEITWNACCAAMLNQK